MTAYIRLQNFITAAQTAYNAPQQQHLVFDHVPTAQVNQPQQDRVVLQPVANRSSHATAFQEQNRRTWNAFYRCLREVIGPEKVQAICSKYRFNIEKMERDGVPLLSEHVELFSVGASQMTTRDLKRRFPGKLSQVNIDQLPERARMANPFPIVGWFRDPRDIWGTPTNYAAWVFHDAMLMDKEKQLLLSDVADLTFPAWQERFCKCTVNREFEAKQVIPAPGPNGTVQYYKVHRKVATGDGLVAYALLPIGAGTALKPIVLFRPSQFALSNEDAIQTYMNDVQRNIGEMGYLAARRLFNDLMNDPKFCPPSTKIDVAGYSLGGTHAQRFVADHWRKVGQATFYNDPSVENELAERFAAEVNAEPPGTVDLRLNIYRSTNWDRGDLAHYVGGKHLGWGIANPNVVTLLEFDHRNREISALQLHARRVFDNPSRNYHATVHNDPAELNAHLDNEQRGPAIYWYEKNRLIWGGVVFWLLHGLHEVTKFFCAFLSIEILRSSKPRSTGAQ